jgi:hypothetical protein
MNPVHFDSPVSCKSVLMFPLSSSMYLDLKRGLSLTIFLTTINFACLSHLSRHAISCPSHHFLFCCLNNICWMKNTNYKTCHYAVLLMIASLSAPYSQIISTRSALDSQRNSFHVHSGENPDLTSTQNK